MEFNDDNHHLTSDCGPPFNENTTTSSFFKSVQKDAELMQKTFSSVIPPNGPTSLCDRNFKPSMRN